MDDRVTCPQCQAQLHLPRLPADQTVQCPRCQNVFAPVRPAPAVTPAADTLDDEPMPEELPPLVQPRPLAGGLLAKVAMVLLALSTLAYAVEIYIRYEHSQLLEQAPHLAPPRFIDFRPLKRRGPVDEAQAALKQRWNNWSEFSIQAKIFHHATFWPAMIVFLLWLGRANKNARALGAQGMFMLPATAVLSFFIPVVNLFWPYMAMQEIWRASDPELIRTPHGWKNASGSPLILLWWLCLLAATGSFLLVGFFLGDEFDIRDHLDEKLMCLSRIVAVLEGILLILIIRRIMHRQAERHERLCEAVVQREAQE